MRRILILCALLLSVFGFGQGYVDRIRQKGELVICTDATYPPFEVKKDDKVVGFDVAIGEAIGRRLGVKVRWLDQEWAGVMASLETGKCDLVMAGVTITEERKTKGYLFSRPYFPSGQCIVRRKGDSRIQKPEDLRGVVVAVQQETTGQYAVQKLGVPKDKMLRFDQSQDALASVVTGQASAAVGDLPTFRDSLQHGYRELEIVGPVFVKENLGIVAWKTHPELISQVNAALATALVDGTYAKAYQEWLKEPFTPATVAEMEAAKDAGSKVPEATEVSKAPVASVGPEVASAFAFRWDLAREALPKLLEGAGLTVKLTLLSILIGLPTGLLIALMRISPLVFLRPIAMFYTEVVRGTPLLMQIYVIYFVVPAILPRLGFSVDSFTSGVLALSLNAAAYCAEIFRAGIESIDPGQMEAARAIGLDYKGAMRWVILPQTLRRVLPPLTNEAIALLKDSSLVSVVALSELMRQGKEFATNQGSPITIYLEVAAIYLAMTLPMTWLVRRLEAKWQPISRPRQGARRLRKVAA